MSRPPAAHLPPVGRFSSAALPAPAAHLEQVASLKKAASLQQAVSPAPIGASAPAKAAHSSPELHKAAVEFEGIFVKQLLQAAKFGGKEMEKGYGAMALDALVSGVQAGGGLGLAREIERALDQAQHPATARRP